MILSHNQEVLLTRQRHEADRAGLHYDIRMVVGDVAHSWATKKEMPEPGSSIILWQQPDHTANYALSKRVEIPKGQYGSGTTILDKIIKAKIHNPNEDTTKFVMETKTGDRFLFKKLSEDYAKDGWLFKNLGSKMETTKNNKYLDKIAELTTQELEQYNSAKTSIKGSPQKILGYHTAYHGTSKESAKSILREGLIPNRPQNSMDSPARLHNKVFVSKNIKVPKLFAAGSDADARDFMMKEYEKRGSPKSTKDMLDISDRAFNKTKKVTILKTRIPNAYWNHMKIDEYMPHDLYGKNQSAYLNRKLPAKYIGSKSIIPHLDPRSILKHLSKDPGSVKEGFKDIFSGIKTISRLSLKKRF